RSARAAFSRKRAANSALDATCSTTRSSISSGSRITLSTGGASSASGRRSTIPSSLQMACTSRPSRALMRCSMARAQGACTRATELIGPAELVAMPEGQLARLAGRGRDDHPVAVDLLDPPGARSEEERLARAALIDHLLVELPDPVAVGQEHAEQSAVRDGPA